MTNTQYLRMHLHTAHMTHTRTHTHTHTHTPVHKDSVRGRWQKISMVKLISSYEASLKSAPHSRSLCAAYVAMTQTGDIIHTPYT